MILNSLFENIPPKTIGLKKETNREEKMIRKERKQNSIFGDNWVYKTILEKFPDHPLVRLKPIVNKILESIEEDMEFYYSKDFGRPSYPPSVILKMLLLEYLYNLSDVAVASSVACNMLFKWFCGLDIDEDVPDDSTLVKFRKRLGEDGFKEVFARFMEEAKQLGYSKGKLRILDATHVLSFSRGLSLGSLLKDGIKRVMKTVKEKTLTLSEKVKDQALKVIEVKRKVKIRELNKIVRELIKELSGEADKRTKKVLNLLKQAADGAKKIGSVIDLDAGWGRKSKDFSFFGYKVHLACDEKGFVTNLEVLPGQKHEGSRLKEMVAKEPKEGVEGVCADALYDSAVNREYLKDLGIKAYIPPRISTSEIDKFTVEVERVKCIAGKYSIGKIVQENGELHYFSVKDCRGCKNYADCVSPGEIRKKVYLSDCKRMREEEYKEKIKLRKTIERLFGWGKRWLGLSRARYFGLGNMLIQAIMTFIALDLKTMIRGPCGVEVV